MKISCAFALLACVAAATSSSEGQKSESQKSSAGVSPSPVAQPLASYPGPSSAQYPAQGFQFAAEYNGPFGAKSAFAPKAAAVPSSYYGAYQPYQQQPYYGFGGPYQQQYFPASGYAAYPSAYSSQPTAAHHYNPAPYSAYPYAAQPYHHGYSPYPFAVQPYNGQYVSAAGPSSVTPYSAAGPSSATPYSAAAAAAAPPSAYQQHQPHHPSSFYNAEAAAASHLRQYQEPYQSAQPQYPPFYPNPPKAANPVAADPAKDDRK